MGSSRKHKKREKERYRERSRSRERYRRKKTEERNNRRYDDAELDRAPPRSAPRNASDEEDYPEAQGRRDSQNQQDVLVRDEPMDIEEPFEQGELEEPPDQSHASLSVTQTNKLRAKLGLKPLASSDVSIPGLDADSAEPTKPEEVFVKTENLSELEAAAKFREKLQVMKEKRKVMERLSTIKPIANPDSDEEETAAAWVKKSRKIEEEKEQAEKRAKLLEEMDKEFGLSEIIEEEFQSTKPKYTSRDLKGMKVLHDTGMIQEGQQVILTLKDKGVLNEDDDVLQNVNLVDEERYAKNVANKKRKKDYQPYEEEEYDDYGLLKQKNLLSKYDEEIHGEEKKSFTLGTTSEMARQKEMEAVRIKLRQQQQGVTLEMPNRPVNEYYTQDDMVQFKKPKKKKKVRKTNMLKADDLLAADMALQASVKKGRSALWEPAFQTMKIEQDDAMGNDDLSQVVIGDDAEKELHSVLHKTRKIKQRSVLSTRKHVETLAAEMEDVKPVVNVPTENAGSIVLNATAEFCRSLGDIPTYGMSGNREEAEENYDFEQEMQEERERQELEEQNRGAWNEVNMDEAPGHKVVREVEPILEEEPDITKGVAGALTLAEKKGYLEKDEKKLGTGPRVSQLQAKSYTIEEKFYEDDKFGKRDRCTGPIQDFREKDGYRPDVNLEYIDDSGRLLNSKEAFRYLSHKFHGKGPGKNKVDKRMKKLDQDTKLKQMNSTDTPLNTVKLLQAKQKETQSPFIVLSGGSKTLTQTMISKPTL